jgi:IS605 OrfB family transposase
MAKQKLRTTPRSYTMSLVPAHDGLDRSALTASLWAAHRATCEGARVFGELLLNLRGGLPPELADNLPPKDKKGSAWTDDEQRMLVRGQRRAMVLGWLSVEDVETAERHMHRVADVPTGTRLSAAQAQVLLTDILRTKGVKNRKELDAWWDDCQHALMASIRRDAVWVNRAAAFDARPQGPTPDQAKSIVCFLYGNDFVRLTLPEPPAQRVDSDSIDESDDDLDEPVEATTEEPKDPSQKSRQVFSDLFGPDPQEKMERGTGKIAFATSLGQFLRNSWDGKSDLKSPLLAWRRIEKQPELSELKDEKFPPEVKSSGSPSTTARRYRKLLVALGAWPADEDEDGTATAQCRKSLEKLFREELKPTAVGTAPRFLAAPLRELKSSVKDAGEKPNAAIVRLMDTRWDEFKVHALVSYVLESCPKESDAAKGQGATATRVFAPKWAAALRAELENVTGLKFGNKSATEFFRLMLAHAARRFSQTHSWMKRNEAERHKAAQEVQQATEALDRLDRKGQARKWLEKYESTRAERGGANEGFRIRPRAISSFDEVLQKWSTRVSVADREEAVAEVQESAEKFGDHDLFLALSKDEAADVWHDADGRPTAETLKAWVKLRRGQFDQGRLLIPRFCHPDSFLHPTFCEFGNSKPSVAYAWRDDPPQKRAAGGERDRERCVWLLLPAAEDGLVAHQPIRWQSKRLWRDLGTHVTEPSRQLSRNDRLGRAAASLSNIGPDHEPIQYRPAHPFSDDTKGWNARLQANREQLASLANQWDARRRKWKDGGRGLLRLRWFLTFSPDLALADGPWSKYAIEHGLNSSPKSAPNKNLNGARGSLAKHHLSRLPGLRVLAVDLGHRYAAACAVWETLSSEQFKAECLKAKADGKTVQIHEMFAVIESPERETNAVSNKARRAGRAKKFKQATLYRRIGPDVDPLAKDGGQAHPAPWARLARQFLIKLQGEDKPARMASPIERCQVEALEQALRLNRTSPRTWADICVDRLMADAVRIAELALRRHGDRARIAYNFITSEKLLPGGKKARIGHDPAEHAKFLEQALLTWARLAVSPRWADEWAHDLWDEFIVRKVGGPPLPKLADEATRSERKEWEEQLSQSLSSVAEKLRQNESLRMKLHVLWATRWREDDGKPAQVDKKTGTCLAKGTGWYERLRWLRNWIVLGTCEAKSERREVGQKLSVSQLVSLRNVGGLSLSRIAAFKSLYQLQKSFRMRPEPDDVRKNVLDRDDDSLVNFARTTLRAMERMRENRVKQLASRITAAALGLGKDLQPRPDDARFAPCHAVVIENLKRYRPDELQTRRENRQLMSWSSAKVRKFLEEACELAGLHFREVSAAYTSRQDSRTGAPGIRCQDVPVSEFLAPSGYWHTQIERARRKADDKKGDARDRYLLDLSTHWSQVPESQRRSRCIRVPQRGGEVFVSVAAGRSSQQDHTDRRGPPGMQADLNAAANIGLKALIDPDWPGRWWWVPCSADGKPVTEKVAGSVAFPKDLRLSTETWCDVAPKHPEEASATDKSGSSIVNLWRDLCAETLDDCSWRVFKAYWNDVQSRAVAILRAHTSLPKQSVRTSSLDDGQSPF